MAMLTMDFIELNPVNLNHGLDVDPNFEEATVEMLIQPIEFLPDEGEGDLPEKVTTTTSGKPLCTTCGRTFSNPANLRNHYRAKHEFSGTYKCQTCSKTFTCKNNFLGHMNKHTKEKPYECSICFKRYMYKQSLDAHIKHCSPVKRKSTEYYCSYCKLSFKCSKYLKEHNKTLHATTTLMCQCECGERFKWRSALKKHRDKGCVNRD